MKSVALLVALSFLAASGCVFYFDDGPDPDPCDEYGYGQAEDVPTREPAPGIRNPETGQCEYFGGGGATPVPCSDECGRCPPDVDFGDWAPLPSWGFCESECTGLDEQTCLATSGCRGAYVPCIAGDCDRQFLECWAVDMTGPVQGGECAVLGAYECSRHDDCIAIHNQGCNDGFIDCTGVGDFSACANEPVDGCYEDFECGPGLRCNAQEVCRPDPACESTGSGGEAPGLIDCTDPACYGECVPGAPDPGLCYAEVTCEILPEQCPEGTTHGIRDGCYTGYCIPYDQCEVVPCAEVGFEAACIAQIECMPLYTGVNCACEGDLCSCEDWIFTSCDGKTI